MARDDKPPVFDQFDAKLKHLRGGKPAPRDADEDRAAGRIRLGDGFQVGIELVAGVVGGLAIGWVLDSWLVTRPLFLVVFLFLGFGAGLLNVYRTLKRFAIVQEDDKKPGSDL